MAKQCICVNCGFRHEAASDQKSSSKPPHKTKENPFAARGREEFSELMAKVEAKKQRILKRSGTDNALMVRFVHSNDNKLKPVIIKAKSDIGLKNNTSAAAAASVAPAASVAAVAPTSVQVSAVDKTQEKLKLDYYLVATVISALLLLIFLEILWNLSAAASKR
ncbi:hypothetical protein BVRB_1g015040 [Beta vulgaris subsp. vulgaris]|nr:hypothetical protein BVRB_1g015040 [Beta vulgaris subsp. vulgaris]